MRHGDCVFLKVDAPERVEIFLKVVYIEARAIADGTLCMLCYSSCLDRHVGPHCSSYGCMVLTRLICVLISQHTAAYKGILH